MSIRSVLNSIHHGMANSPGLTRLALLLRNQADCVIAYRMGESPHQELNGELALQKVIAPLCKTVFDVGANVGDWTDTFLKQAASECSSRLYEPGKATAEALLKRFSGNPRITLRNVAVGSSPGELVFYEEENCGVHSSLIADAGMRSQKRSVPVVTIDQELADAGMSGLDYLKVDTEGYDYWVLEGAKVSLSRHSIRFLQFEYNAPWAKANSTLYGALALLKQSGYKVFLIRSDGLFLLNYETYGEFFRYSNFFAVREEDERAVAQMIKGEI